METNIKLSAWQRFRGDKIYRLWFGKVGMMGNEYLLFGGKSFDVHLTWSHQKSKIKTYQIAGHDNPELKKALLKGPFLVWSADITDAKLKKDGE